MSTNKFPQSAEEWLIYLRSDIISEETAQAFENWLNKHPDNETAYEKCEMIAQMSQELKDDPELAPYLNECKAEADQYFKGKSYNTFIKKRMAQVVATISAFAAVLAITFITIQPESYETKIGEQRTVMLDDKSLVQLNTNTKLMVDYTDTERLITMEKGEAIFNVIPDKKRPFRVLAAQGTATALGTVFSVVMNQEKVTVTVLEGTVRVESTSKEKNTSSSPVLAIGEAVSYQDKAFQNHPYPANLERILAWREGKLVFDNMPLSDAIKEHNRYTTTRIILGDTALEKLTVSGVFRIGDTQSLLFLLENSLNLKIVSSQDSVVLYTKEPTINAHHT